MFQSYADYYDLLYREKDYEAECDFLEDIFSQFASAPVRCILDLGCGTGGHALRLARRGYQVTGVDQSENMLSLGRRKAAEMPRTPDTGSVVFHRSDIRTLDLKPEQTFDVVIAMFAVLSYLETNEDLASALQGARRHLKQGGLLVFDAWFGPAVLTQRPTDRFRVIECDEERIVRFASASLDILGHGVRVDYTLLRVKQGQVLDEVQESHWQRFLFPQEIKHYLDENGFRLLKLCPFMELAREPTEQDWYFTTIAQGT
jgi:SAM-dependent methyltransferase